MASVGQKARVKQMPARGGGARGASKGEAVGDRPAKQLHTPGRLAAGKRPVPSVSSSLAAESRAATSLRPSTAQTAKSTVRPPVKGKQDTKQGKPVTRGPPSPAVRKPLSPQSAAIGDITSEDSRIQRSDTFSLRDKNLVASSAHRSEHHSDQQGKQPPSQPSSPDQQHEYSNDFEEEGDYESDFEEEASMALDGEEGRGCKTEEEEGEKGKKADSRSEGSLIRRDSQEKEEGTSISSSADTGIIAPDAATAGIKSTSGRHDGGSQQLVHSSRRHRDLSSVIKLNAVTYPIHSHPGISYEVYMSMFGRRNHRQAATQTTERQEQSMQTETLLTKDSWVQHPFYCYATEQDKPFYHSTAPPPPPVDPFSLLDFLIRSERILKIVIRDFQTRSQTPNITETTRTKSARRVMKLPVGSEKFCSQFHKLIGMSSLKKLPVSIIRAESSLVVSVQVDIQSEQSFLLLWPACDACRPDHVLRSRAIVTCCHWTGDGCLVAGTREGSFQVWDMRVCHDSYTSKIDVESGFFVPRDPAFASSCVQALADAHQSSIVAIDGVGRKEEMERGSRGESTNGCNRLAAVDEDGVISFWCLESVAIKQSELTEGMFPGSKCRLVLEARKRLPVESCATFLCSAGADEDCFLVGTDVGRILEASRFLDGSSITYTQIREDAECILSSVSGISVNPRASSLFLASYGDGTISLFCRSSHSSGAHLMTWDATDTQISAALSVHWLPSSPSAFVSLSSTAALLLWDLETMLWKPLLKYQLAKVTCMSPTDEKDAGLAFGTEDGNIEVMSLSDAFRSQKDLTPLITRLMNCGSITHV